MKISSAYEVRPLLRVLKAGLRDNMVPDSQVILNSKFMKLLFLNI